MNKEEILKEYQKKDGIEMRLWVDLMIANKKDAKFVNKKLDELKDFIIKAITKAEKRGREEVIEKINELRNEEKLKATQKGMIYGTEYGEGWHGFAIKLLDKLK